MERIWSGATFNCSMEGNIQRAESLEPRARIFAGFLLDQLGGLRIYTQGELQEPDGSTIEAHVWKDMLGERAMVRIVGAPVVGGLQEEIRIEHGWLTKLDNTWPIYTWPELSTYLRRKGTVVDEDGMYKSVLGRSERLDVTGFPSRYSGLTRLFIQAMIGCNYKILDMLPEGWLPTPENLGCIRSPKGVYWLTNASSNGIFAVRLKPTDAIVEIAAQAEAKIVPEDEQIFIDAFVLANQEIVYSGGGPDIEILVPEDDELLQNYFDTYNTPIAWGWCWRYQMRGASDEYTSGACASYGKGIAEEGAPQEMFDKSDYKKVQTANLDIAWESDRPVATLTFDPVQDVYISALMRNACMMVFYSDTAANEMRRLFQREHLSSDIPDEYYTGGIGRFLAWYAPDGEKHSIEIVYADGQTIYKVEGDNEIVLAWGAGNLQRVTTTANCSYEPMHFRYDGFTLGRPFVGIHRVITERINNSPEPSISPSSGHFSGSFEMVTRNTAMSFDGPEGDYPNSEILVICDTPGAVFALAVAAKREYERTGWVTGWTTPYPAGITCVGVDCLLGMCGFSDITDCSEDPFYETSGPIVEIPYKFFADGTSFPVEHEIFSTIREKMFLTRWWDDVVKPYSVPSSISYGGRKIVPFAQLDADILNSAAQEKGIWIGGV